MKCQKIHNIDEIFNTDEENLYLFQTFSIILMKLSGKYCVMKKLKVRETWTFPSLENTVLEKQQGGQIDP